MPTKVQILDPYPDVLIQHLALSDPKLFEALTNRKTVVVEDPIVGTANVADGSITEPKLADNSVSTRTIQTSAVIASKISIANLAALSGDLGAITAGSLTGVAITMSGSTFQTTSSGSRIQITGAGGIAVFNSGGTLVGQWLNENFDGNDIDAVDITATSIATIAGNIYDADGVLLSTGDSVAFGGRAATNSLISGSGTVVFAALGDGSGYSDFNARTITLTQDLTCDDIACDVLLCTSITATADISCDDITCDVILASGNISGVDLSASGNITGVNITITGDLSCDDITCDVITPTTLNYSFGGITNTFDPNGITSMTFSDGILTAFS